MKKTSIKLYNVIFPIWMLWLIPITWLAVLPANFLIDLLVIVLTMKFMKVPNVKENAKRIILRVWICGFIADFIGTMAMLISNFINFNHNSKLDDWWYDNIQNAVTYNPFESIYAILWVAVSILITSFFIYLFNYKFCLNKSTLDSKQRKLLSLSLAIFTAPYLFYLPTYWFL